MAMFGLNDTWKVTLLGDARRGELLVPLAFVQANVLREYCSFQKLHVGFRSFASYEEGFEVSIRKIGGHYEITIDTAIVSDVREKSKIDPFIVPLVLFSDGNAAWWYNYYNNNLAAIGLASSSRGLVPIYNGRSQQGEENALVIDGSWAVNPIVGSAGTDYLGGVNFNEVAFFASGSSIYGRSGDDGWLAVVLNSAPVIAMSGAQSNLFGVITKVSSAWNLADSSELITINPATNAAANKWIWTPNFYRKTPGNGTSRNGWFYGPRDASPYEVFDPLTSATVDFKGLLDCRFSASTSLYKHGYAEMVTSYLVDDRSGNTSPTNVADLYIYVSQSPLLGPARDYEYYQRDALTQNGSHAYATMGDIGLGIDYEVMITLNTDKYRSAKIDMWSFESWENEASLLYAGPSGAIGIAAIAGSNAKFYRYKGITSGIFETANYHSHIISRDGSILCVLEGGSVIESIRVFDLYGKRGNAAPYSDNDVYATGGITEIRHDAVKVAALGALTSCVIPYRVENFEPAEPNKTTGYFDYSDDTAKMPSLSSMAFSTRGLSPLDIQKIVINDGVNAKFSIEEDSCFDSEIYVEEDAETSDFLIATSTWVKDLRNMNLSMRGKFTDSPFRFRGVGDPAIIITRPPGFKTLLWSGDQLTFEDYLGDIIIGNCIEEREDGNYYVEQACREGCGSSFTLSATTTCGQKVTGDIEKGLPDELYIIGDEAAVEGGGYSGGGGVVPYTYTISCGSIGESSGSIPVGGLTGCCGTGSVTVEDSCGSSATMEVRFPDGYWMLIDTEDFRPGFPAGSITNIGVNTYTGGIRYNEYYNADGSTYETVMRAGTTGNFNPTSCAGYGLYDEWLANGYCCAPTTVPSYRQAYGDANSYGEILTSAASSSPSICDGAYDMPAILVAFRAWLRYTYSWECSP